MAWGRRPARMVSYTTYAALALAIRESKAAKQALAAAAVQAVLVSCRCPQAPGIYTCVDDPDRGIYT